MVKAAPLEILIVLLKDPQATNAFTRFLLGKVYLTTSDANLIITMLCQIGFSNAQLISKLRLNELMRDIIDTFNDNSLYSDLPKYFELTYDKIHKITNLQHIIDQIMFRRISENTRSYSIALNHLLNELHAICWAVDQRPNKGNFKDYNAKSVDSFLISKRVSNEVSIKIKNLFDRRNTNQISHPGSEQNIPQGVSREEYFDYRYYVGLCLEQIL